MSAGKFIFHFNHGFLTGAWGIAPGEWGAVKARNVTEPRGKAFPLKLTLWIQLDVAVFIDNLGLYSTHRLPDNGKGHVGVKVVFPPTPCIDEPWSNRKAGGKIPVMQIMLYSDLEVLKLEAGRLAQALFRVKEGK